MGGHKAGYSSLWHCYMLCQISQLSLGQSRFLPRLWGLTLEQCPAWLTLEHILSPGAPSHHKSPDKPGVQNFQLLQSWQMVRMPPTVKYPSTCGTLLLFSFCLLFLPLNTMWKKPRSWGQLSPPLEVHFLSIKWKSDPDSGNNQSGDREMIRVTQGFLRLLLLWHKIYRLYNLY